MSGSNGLPSVLFPLQPERPHDVQAFANLVETTGARRLWLGQSLRVDTHQSFAYLAGSGPRVSIGTSVSLMPLRHPVEAAQQARSLASLLEQPVVAGFGASTPGFVRAMEGQPYAAPRSAAHEYLTIVRELLEGRQVDYDGQYHTLSGFRLMPMQHPPVEVGAGVLRPRMARSAGEVADAAITWLTPPHYVRDSILPELRKGASDGGRKTPRVVTIVHVAVAREDRDPTALAHAGSGGHLGTAHYTDMLQRSGVPVDPNDTATGADLLVRHGVFVTGTPEEIAAEIARYEESGVDEVVLNTAGVVLIHGMQAALSDLDEILAAVESR